MSIEFHSGCRVGSRFDFSQFSSLYRTFCNGYCTYLTLNVEKLKILEFRSEADLFICFSSSPLTLLIPFMFLPLTGKKDFKFQNATFMRGISPKTFLNLQKPSSETWFPCSLPFYYGPRRYVNPSPSSPSVTQWINISRAMTKCSPVIGRYD